MMSSLTEFRKSKDEFFAHNQHSPLTPAQKQAFNGLSYFPENPALRLEVEVAPFPEQAHIQMQTSTGDVQTYACFGKFSFIVDGTEAQLTIYVNEHGYFLPFVDSQAGEITYGAGRYLEPEELPDGRLLVDFNLAYNPYCVYNDMWSCPIPPAENRIAVPIRAGEKNPTGDWMGAESH
ncbi:MAG: DUF1684 domain-containing protein [Anaerolineales bacterium]|nr:DUF1684 domain-containing protein [Anaerolineales bacterium]